MTFTFTEICKKSQKELKAALVAVLKANNYKPVVQDGFIYAEGDIPVLLVAHMDTVHKEPCTIVCESKDGVLMSPQGIGGDDRCGIFMILETIKELRCSVLFTEDEEIGCIGAKKFCESGIEPSIQFRYIIEYDRKNADDAVFYDCDNPEFEEFVTDEGIGFKTAWGSCSDISYIAPHLKTAAVNLSCGYYNQHTQHEYVVVPEMMKNIERGKQLIRKPCEHFEYIEAVSTFKYNYSYGKYGGYNSYSDYGSKKRIFSSDSFKDYEDVYANIDEVAFSLYEDGYGIAVKREELISVVELCDYGVKEMVVVTEDGEREISDYCCPDLLYMNKDGCGLYVIEEENSWGIQIAVETEHYLKCKDGSQIMYYPSDMEEFPVMNRQDANWFNDYVENFLECDVEYAMELGTLI